MRETAKPLLAAFFVSTLAACSPSSGAADAGVIESCAEAGIPGCYSNADCAAADRCTTPSNADPTVLITCCLPGARGTGDAGSPCTGFDDCETAICAYTPAGLFCSGPCTTDGDCKSPNLPSCVTVDAGSFCGLAP
jgi:hypothetical protein